MSEVLLDTPVRHWACPSCPATVSKPGTVDEQEYHNCAGTAGLTIPLVEVHEPGAPADARHIPQLGAEGNLTSIGTEHGANSKYPGRVDRTIIAGPVRAGQKEG